MKCSDMNFFHEIDARLHLVPCVSATTKKGKEKHVLLDPQPHLRYLSR